MRKLFNILFLYVFIVGITGCAAYVDSRREAGYQGTIGSSSPSRIVICYNGYITEEDELEAMANTECSKIKAKAELDRTEFATCSLFAPSKVIYNCVDEAGKAVNYQSNSRKEQLLAGKLNK